MQEYKKLSEIIVHHSCRIKKGEKVLIETQGIDNKFVIYLIREIRKAGGVPFVSLEDQEINRELFLGVTEEQATMQAKHMLTLMKQVDAWVGIRGMGNLFEYVDVPADKMDIKSRIYDFPVHLQERVHNTKWVILAWPTKALAQSAGMSTETFSDMFFKVCTLDYSKMDRAMDPLIQRLKNVEKIRITGKGTDISFSVKGQNAIKCSGVVNLPDGELYYGPLRDSVNGVITYNIPSKYQGTTYNNVRLEVVNGKIINASASENNEKLNKIFDTDEGARYFGEFAFGLNPYVRKPINEILFDEKMCGSFHLTPGACYEDSQNGNVSAVHWDLVCSQTAEFGGGEIWFDDILARKDGIFVLPELQSLNPENLI